MEYSSPLSPDTTFPLLPSLHAAQRVLSLRPTKLFPPASEALQGPINVYVARTTLYGEEADIADCVIIMAMRFERATRRPHLSVVSHVKQW